MPCYELRGVKVEFPYDAYECQLNYMTCVIEALQEGKHALLESPTGTGKTLCLLCATLAWRESLKEKVASAPEKIRANPHSSELVQGLKEAYAEYKAEKIAEGEGLPTIIYSSRTHSQLKQVMKELARTSYQPKTTVLGSRQQSCLNPNVNRLPAGAANQACRALTSKRNCRWNWNVEEFMNKTPEFNSTVRDIEDLVKFGEERTLCPYFLSREMAASADLVFMPYNYLVDVKTRGKLGISWKNAVLIFDEAHNVEGVCADAVSFDLPAAVIAGAIEEAGTAAEIAISRADAAPRNVANAFGNLGDAGKSLMASAQSIRQLQLVLQKLELEIAALASRVMNERGITYPGIELFNLFRKINLTPETWSKMGEVMERATGILTDDAVENGQQRGSRATSYKLHALQEALTLAFDTLEASKPGHAPLHFGYRMHIHFGNSSSYQKNNFISNQQNREKLPTLSYWCFSPGQAMTALSDMQVRSILLTSGTLSPLGSFAAELGLPFEVRLENPHVIDQSQIWAGVVTIGPQGYHLNSSYSSRDRKEYKEDLGNSIVNFARIIPDGILVFFPSYSMLTSCIDHWKDPSQTSSIWDRIQQYKAIIIEPRESNKFPEAAAEFKSKLESPDFGGSIFFAVCRGKASEGLDFADNAGRAVIITGIPYATKNDPKVQIKQDILNETVREMQARKRGLGKDGFLGMNLIAGNQSRTSNTSNVNQSEVKGESRNSQDDCLTGSAWYSQQAMRAVNQAIGRVIRHKRDYGAIILCDERFSRSNVQSDLSKWLRSYVHVHKTYGKANQSLTNFFKQMAEKERRGEVASGNSMSAMKTSRAQKPSVTGTSSSGLGYQKVSAFQFANRRGDGSDIKGVSKPLIQTVPSAKDVIGIAELVGNTGSTIQLKGSEDIIQHNKECKDGKSSGLINILGDNGLSKVDSTEKALTKISSTKVQHKGCRTNLDFLLDQGNKRELMKGDNHNYKMNSFGLKPWERPIIEAKKMSTGNMVKGQSTSNFGIPPSFHQKTADVVGPAHLVELYQKREIENGSNKFEVSTNARMRETHTEPVPLTESRQDGENLRNRSKEKGVAYGAKSANLAENYNDCRGKKVNEPKPNFNKLSSTLRDSHEIAKNIEKQNNESVKVLVSALRNELAPESATRLFSALGTYRKTGSVENLITVAAMELHSPKLRHLASKFRNLIPSGKRAMFDTKLAGLSQKRLISQDSNATRGKHEIRNRYNKLDKKDPNLRGNGKVPRGASSMDQNHKQKDNTPSSSKRCASCGKSPMEGPHKSTCCNRIACMGCWLRAIALRKCEGCGKTLKKSMLQKQYFCDTV